MLTNVAYQVLHLSIENVSLVEKLLIRVMLASEKDANLQDTVKY